MAIIEADAYGHGAVLMMEYMLKYGICHFGVAPTEESMGVVAEIAALPNRWTHVHGSDDDRC